MWDYQIYADAIRLRNLPQPSFDPKEAATALAAGKIGYLCGKAIKTDFNRDSIDLTNNIFEIIAGVGSIKKIVDGLRTNAPAVVPRPTVLKCPERNTKFSPYGEPTIRGDEGSTMCEYCVFVQKEHELVRV
jgi:hypothetical protein